MWKSIGLVLVAIIAFSVAEDKTISSSGITTKVMGRSGKLRVCRSNYNETADCVVISPDALREVDANDAQVGKTGQVKHSIESFASVDFIFSELMDNVSVPNSNGTVKATSITFNSTLATGATLAFTVYVITGVPEGTDEGEVVIDGEQQILRVGMVKFNVMIDGWQWCDPCREGNADQIGTDLVFVLEVKSKTTPTKDNNTTGAGGMRKTQRYALGGGASLDLSNKVQADGMFVDMASGYPTCRTQGPKYICDFKFSKANNVTSFTYDPAIDMESQDEPSRAPTTVAPTTSLSVRVTLLGPWMALCVIISSIAY